MAFSPRVRLVETPNPAELGLAVSVPNSLIYEGVLPVPSVTAYKSWALLDRSYVQRGYGDYVYTGPKRESDNDITFFFAKNRTAEERETPFRTTKEFGNHRWPPILKALAFFTDPNWLHATNSQDGGLLFAKKYYVREVFIPEVNEGTLFTTEEFFSETPFDIPVYEVPVPTAISYDIFGARGSFPESLHGRIVIPNFRSAVAKYVSGSLTDIGGSVRGQVFPATNFETWEAYTLSDKQDFQVGFYRTRVSVEPPEEPEIIIR